MQMSYVCLNAEFATEVWTNSSPSVKLGFAWLIYLVDFRHHWVWEMSADLYLMNAKLTCVGVRWIKLAKCSLSGADKYFCCLNLLSSS